MKPLYILARARRSVDTLEGELDDLESKIGQSFENAVSCGDLILWPVHAVSGAHRKGDHTREFWEVHRTALETGLLSEIVIGEIGRSMFSSSESLHADRFQNRSYLYGAADGATPVQDAEDEEDEFDEYELADAYQERLFWTVGSQNWFDHATPDEDTRTLGRKLLITIGRDRDKRFLDSPMGQKLRARLGERASVVFNSRYEDAAVIALERGGSPSDLFEDIKRYMPPRLVEDFLIMDIGVTYCTGNEPISVFREWAERRHKREPESRTPPSGGKPRPVIVEKAKRRNFR